MAFGQLEAAEKGTYENWEDREESSTDPPLLPP